MKFFSLLASFVLAANAAVPPIHYSDVPTGVWFEDAVSAFLEDGYLDATKAAFRPAETATRAEFVKLVVETNGGILQEPPVVPTFDDVPTNAWYRAYMEEAAKEEWLLGDGNCAGVHPCGARPDESITRAEAIALIVRAFDLGVSGDAPRFVDVPEGAWYAEAAAAAADGCVVGGDDATGRLRPMGLMNRAEMVAMLHRVDQGLAYGVDCGLASSVGIRRASQIAPTTIEVEFMKNTEAPMDASLYSVTGQDERPLGVESVTIVNAKTVQLELGEPIALDCYGMFLLTIDMAETDYYTRFVAACANE
jgi:hypothetical protein